MFKYLSTKEQLLEEKRKNEALQAMVKELEKLKPRIFNAEQIAADNSIAQQEMLELLLEIGVI